MNAIRLLTVPLWIALLHSAALAGEPASDPSAAPAASPAAGSPATAAAPAGPLEIGQPAPLRDLPMKSVDGSEVSIASAAGKRGTLVIFMCNHCPWVQAWQGRIAAIGSRALELGVGVIAVNPNDPEALPTDDYASMVAQAGKLSLKFPYVVDSTSDLARAFGATRTPEAFLFDAKGKLVYHGTVDDNARNEDAVKQPWLKDAVEAVAAGRKVAAAETKALGCSMKLRPAKS
ncbi:MAG TPA: thioredoxin family protein [Candidatus Saccharimonadales bacterium]|nr:thioredoxin family protein [Candidatus Saccharimonadales bacterium]